MANTKPRLEQRQPQAGEARGRCTPRRSRSRRAGTAPSRRGGRRAVDVGDRHPGAVGSGGPQAARLVVRGVVARRAPRWP